MDVVGGTCLQTFPDGAHRLSLAFLRHRHGVISIYFSEFLLFEIEVVAPGLRQDLLVPDKNTQV